MRPVPNPSQDDLLCLCRDTALRWGRGVRRTAGAMIGQPDYQAYVDHAATTHPDQPPLDKTAFFRLHEQRRFGGAGGFKCC
jgi:uncharacterized short protein YbdD (DUF466 family)